MIKTSLVPTRQKPLFRSSWARLGGPLLALLLGQCRPEGAGNAPAVPLMVAKYRVLDERLSPANVTCSNPVLGFLLAGPNACSFRVGGLEFDIKDKYEVDATGHLRTYWSYHSEGPVAHSLAELQQDEPYAQQVGVATFHVELLAGSWAVVDSGDTLAVETHYPKEKLLLAKRNAHTPAGYRLIYQYQ